MRRILVFMLFLFVCFTLSTAVPEAFGQNVPSEVLSELLSNPTILLIFLIQLGLGFGLGYFTMKVLKYIIAIIGILILGVLLNVWQFGGLEKFLERLGFSLDFPQLIAMINSVALLLGILTILPIGVGFFIGVIVAVRK